MPTDRSSGPGNAIAGSAPSHVRWFLIFWLFVLSAVAFLDRVNISIAGSSIASEYHLTNVELGWVFSSFLAGYALFQTLGGRLADRIRATPCSCWGSGLVGRLHRADRCRSSRHPRRVASFRFHPFLVWSGRGRYLSGVQPICLALDSESGTWHREWLDLRRSGRRGWTLSSPDHLHHAALRLESVVLGMRS